MGNFCEGMRGRAWPGSGGALRTVVAAMLLTLCRSQTVPRPTSCTAGDARQNLTQPEYNNSLYHDDSMYRDSGFGYMAPLVRSFLHTVQPNPFPKDLILKQIREFSLTDSENIKEVMLHEVGFLVCAIVGLLYIILMPIIGMFLACCRCCGNCGGEMHQEQTPSIHCRRRCLYWCTFAVTAVILAGNICMLKSNEDLNVSVTQIPTQFNAIISNIDTFIKSLPPQIQTVVDESFTTIDTIASNLNNIGPQLGAGIQERFRGTMDPLLDSLRQLNGGVTDFKSEIENLGTFLTQQEASITNLRTDITSVRDGITATLDTCGVPCDNIRGGIGLNELTLGPTSPTPSTDAFDQSLTRIDDIDLPSKISLAEGYFNSIPQTVTNVSRDAVQQANGVLEKVKTKISNVTGTVSISALTNTMDASVQLYADQISRSTKYAEDIRYKVCIALCCVVVLVVVCNALGLLLGPLGLTPKADPTMRSCTADSGGTFFIMSAGFSFLFSWLLMLLVLVLFLLGGHVHTLVCRPWSTGQLFQLIDSSGLVPDIGQMLGVKSKIGITHIYRGCTANQTVWETLKMNELIDLDEVLNTADHAEAIQEQFDSMDLQLSTTSFLSPEVSDALGSFTIDTSAMESEALTEQINVMSALNLNETADELDVAANTLPATPATASTAVRLRNHANELRQIQVRIETVLIPQMKQLRSTATEFPAKASEMEGLMSAVLTNVEAAQVFLNTNTSLIVKTESKAFLDCQLSHLDNYIAWAKLMITQQMGKCKPLAEIVDFLEVILCLYLLGPLNGFWCSLGWCLLFLIPSIIFSIKLAKYYRKMKVSDVYDDDDIASHKLDMSPNENELNVRDAQYLEEHMQPWPPHQPHTEAQM